MFVKYCHFLILCLLGLTIAAEVAEKVYFEKDSGKDGSHSSVILQKDQNSTTDKPITTPISTTTIPPAPNTTVTSPTTTIAPITTPAPTIPPDVKPDAWNISENGTNCILAKMAIDFSVSYNTSNNETKTVHFMVPSTAKAEGRCGKLNETLKLPFNYTTGNITFTFSYNDSVKEYYTSLINVEVEVNNKTFPNNTWVNTTKLLFKVNGQLFTNSVNRSYTCASPDSIKMNTTLNVTNSLKLSKIQLEAFGSHKDKNFSAGIDCVTSETPDIVPIVVGTTLGILVVVVLIGFLVSRRRSQSRGYLSM